MPAGGATSVCAPEERCEKREVESAFGVRTTGESAGRCRPALTECGATFAWRLARVREMLQTVCCKCFIRSFACVLTFAKNVLQILTSFVFVGVWAHAGFINGVRGLDRGSAFDASQGSSPRRSTLF